MKRPTYVFLKSFGSVRRVADLAVRMLAALVITAVCPLAAAADFPQRAIQVILSFPPGGATDVLARELAKKMGDTLGQSIVVLNRPGAGGFIGMQAGARADPDGYVLYVSSVMSNAIYEGVNGKQSVSLLSDFVPVGGIASAPHILIAPTKIQVDDFSELVEHLKSAPGKYNYASMGAGTLSNLEAEIFLEQTGTKAMQIPYKGSGQALPEVIDGTSAFMFDSVTSALPHVQGNRIKVLGVASAKRLALMPDVSTMKELGVDGLEAENLFALMAPAGTPDDRVAVVADALRQAQEDPAFVKAIGAQGFQVSEIDRAALPGFITDQQRFWREKVKELNIGAPK